MASVPGVALALLLLQGQKSRGYFRKLFILLDKIVEYFAKGNIVKGRSTVIFGFRDQSNGKKTIKKRLKWRKLEDDHARLSYLYTSMIESKLDSGADIRSSDTPDEISRNHTGSEAEGELFDCYSSHRYYEAAPLNGENLARIKERLGIK